MAAKRGRPKNPPNIKEMLHDVIPIDDIFDGTEKKLYKNLVKIYMSDFDIDDLTSSDMDDIFDLAKNKVMEIRLLSKLKDTNAKGLDSLYSTIDKMKKQNEKIKENLSSRRKDRINPKQYSGKSIVDLVAAFDDSKKAEYMDKVRKMRENEEAVLEKRKDYSGNRYDVEEIKETE